MAEIPEITITTRHQTQVLGIARPGDVVLVECEQHLTEEQFRKLRQHFGSAASNVGLKALVLPKGFRVARVKYDAAGIDPHTEESRDEKGSTQRGPGSHGPDRSPDGSAPETGEVPGKAG